VHHSLWSLQQPPVAAPPAARVWVAARHRSGPSTDSMAENGNQAALKRQREPAGSGSLQLLQFIGGPLHKPITYINQLLRPSCRS
jgi:hypothetical protein